MKHPQPPSPTQPRVLVVGPMAPAVGGMATLIEQLLSGSLARSVTFVRHATNRVTSNPRSPLRSACRHVRRMAELVRTVVAGRIDLVHIYTCSGFTFYRNAIDAFIARRCGARVILHVCGGRFGDFCAGAGFVGRRMIRRALSRADRVVVLSQGWRDLLAGFAPDARFEVIPCGVPVPAETTDPADTRDAGPCRFLFLGAVGRAKGTDTLIEAAGRLRESGVPFTLTVAGPADQAPDTWSIDQEVRRHGLGGNVECVGLVSEEAKADLLADCDCLVLPSRAEGLPLALLEAGARGRAVVATAVGAVPEVIDDERLGLVVLPDSPVQLADAMGKVAADALARRAMGLALRRRVAAHYSLDRQSSLIAGLYRELIAERSRTPVRCPALAGGAAR